MMYEGEVVSVYTRCPPYVIMIISNWVNGVRVGVAIVALLSKG